MRLQRALHLQNTAKSVKVECRRSDSAFVILYLLIWNCGHGFVFVYLESWTWFCICLFGIMNMWGLSGTLFSWLRDFLSRQLCTCTLPSMAFSLPFGKIKYKYQLWSHTNTHKSCGQIQCAAKIVNKQFVTQSTPTLILNIQRRDCGQKWMKGFSRESSSQMRNLTVGSWMKSRLKLSLQNL